MISLGVIAVIGQVLTMRALTGFHDEKSTWDAREQIREDLLIELEVLEDKSTKAKAAAVTAVAEREQAETNLAEVQAQLVSERSRVLAARDTYSKVAESSAELTAEAVGLRAEIRTFEGQKQGYVIEIAELEAQQTGVADTTQDLVRKRALVETQVTNLEDRRNTLLMELSEAQAKLIDDRQSLGEVQQDLAAARGVIAEASQADAERASLLTDLASARSELSSATTTRDRMIRERDQAIKDRDAFLADLADTRETWMTTTEAAKEASTELAVVQSEVKQLTTHRTELKAEIWGLEQEHTGLLSDAAELRAQWPIKADLEEELASMRTEKKALRTDIPVLRKEQESVQTSLTTLKAEEKAARESVAALKGRKQTLEAAAAALVAQEARLVELKEEIRAAQAKKEAVALELQDLQREAQQYQSSIFEQLRKLAEALTGSDAEKEKDEDSATGPGDSGDDQ